MEHKNYERELKYLLTENSKLSFDQTLHFLNSYGYKVVEIRLKQKHETYHDDKTLTLINRGDVMRSSKHIFKHGTFLRFMYKRNVSNPNKPYVSKLEVGSGQFKTVEEFIEELGLDVKVQPEPILYAEMARDTAVVEKDLGKLLISHDRVKYFKNIGAESVYEEMIEIEDWTNPNSIANADSEYDAHLCEVNKILLDGGLPIKLTKHSKPYRGYKILNEKGAF